MDKVRVDKWLWAARFYKTRSLASDACDGNKVAINTLTAKPAKEVKAGDMVRFAVGWHEWEVEVLALSDKRGSAAIAQTLYRETEASAAKPAGVRCPCASVRTGGMAPYRPETKDDCQRLYSAP